MQQHDGILDNILPFNSLRHVKELELESFGEGSYIHPSWQQWPMAWSRLTALTSLSCRLKHNVRPYVPAVLNHMTSLRRLEVWQSLSLSGYSRDDDQEYPRFEDLQEAAEQMILENTTNLTRLTSLLIDGDPFIGGNDGKKSSL